MKRVPVEAVLRPETTFGECIVDVARAAGLSPRLANAPVPPAEALADSLLLDRWTEAAGDFFGVECEPVETRYSEVGDAVAKAAPCVMMVPRPGGGRGIVPVLRSSSKDLVVLLPGLVRRKVATADVVALLREATAFKVAAKVDRWVADMPVDAARKRRARDALLLEMVGGDRIGGMWLVRPKPGAKLSTQLRTSGDGVRIVLFLLLTITQVGLGILGWSTLFDAALSGSLELSPLLRWALLSISVALVEITRSFVVGRMNVSLASILKRRVLAGTLKLDPQYIRSKGSGGILALISESEILESAGLASVVSVVSATISLFSSAFVLARGAGGIHHVGLLLVWCVAVALAMRWLHRHNRRWTDARLEMTNGLVERMVGHRTRMAQEGPAGRHRAEDAELELYLAESRRVDGLARLIQGLPSRGWLLAGFLMLLPALWAGEADTRLLLIAIGGLFQAQSAFADIAAAVSSALQLSVAWQRAGELFRVAAADEPHGLPAAAVQEIGARSNEGGADEHEAFVLEARNISFRYQEKGEPVLSGLDLRLRKGDRVVLQGASGGGKSTLAALLSGLRDPSSGLVLHHGLDRQTLGTATWRKKVASVPQFHENHLLTGSLLFNLMLGRRWPPAPGDPELAEEVCRALGLGPVLDRMPSGLEQVVGETGWQLSHGERTRVFLARALLQGAEVVIVDESFGALDPHTLRVAIDATWERASTLVVIAHP